MTVEHLKVIGSLKASNEVNKIRSIFIRDLILKCSIGVYKHEKEKPQRVRVNLELIAHDSEKPLDDNINNTVCYAEITERIKEMINRGHINLVETLAERIANLCLTYGSVQLVRVKVEKLDILENAESVGVEIEKYNQHNLIEK